MLRLGGSLFVAVALAVLVFTFVNEAHLTHQVLFLAYGGVGLLLGLYFSRLRGWFRKAAAARALPEGGER